MSTERDLQDDPAAHRTGESDPGGKKSVRLEILVTEQMADDIAAVSSIRKLPKGEYLRRVIERDLYGELEIMRRSVAARDK